MLGHLAFASMTGRINRRVFVAGLAATPAGGSPLAQAAVAHAAAHRRHSPPARSSRGLKPLGQLVHAALEDARVERLLAQHAQDQAGTYIARLAAFDEALGVDDIARFRHQIAGEFDTVGHCNSVTPTDYTGKLTFWYQGIFEGDLIGVHRTRDARSGQIVVARIDDAITVKLLKIGKDRIRLLPRNPDYAPIDVLPDQDFAIEGLYCGLVRPNR